MALVSVPGPFRSPGTRNFKFKLKPTTVLVVSAAASQWHAKCRRAPSIPVGHAPGPGRGGRLMDLREAHQAAVGPTHRAVADSDGPSVDSVPSWLPLSFRLPLSAAC